MIVSLERIAIRRTAPRRSSGLYLPWYLREI